MITDDKITKGGKIESTGIQSPSQAFLLFPVPKTSDKDICIINVKLSQNKEMTDFPLSVNSWNPVVFNSVDIQEQTLADFDIYWGTL